MDTSLDNLRHEIDSAFLYETLASLEKNASLAEVYRRLATVERRHAEQWAVRLRDTGAPTPVLAPSLRARLLGWVARRFGPGVILPTMVSLEQVDSHTYALQAAPDLAGQERSHGRLLREIAGGRAGLAGSTIAQIEGRHRAVGGNALRAAVLGANDGLVSNLSLVMGVAGAALSGQAILVAGFAGLLAGAFSMALGEWLSVQSSRELYARQLRTEETEIRTAPEEELEELVLIYQARGILEPEARRMAERVMQDEERALDTLAREELAIDPKELGGSAWEAALASFLLFAVGAIIPVLPFLFFAGPPGIYSSLAVSGVGLFVIGAGTTLFTARSVLWSGLRQVLFGLAAAAITFGIGRLIGVSLSG
jgi:VIT1/CCC1 family predicted Fe2+/Mn2+ transporter